MAYTPISLTPTTAPLMALYAGENTRTYQARPVYAMALYRDFSDRDGGNFCGPITAKGLTFSQDDPYRGERSMQAALPVFIRENQEWWDLAQDSVVGYIEVELTSAGWVVVA